MRNTIYLHAQDENDVRLAAQFVAELQRQGLAFEATTGVITGKGGISGVPGLVVEVSGH